MLRQRRLWVLLLPLGVAAFGVVLASSWLPLLFSLPWLAAIAWFSRRDSLDEHEPPSLADAARTRLRTR
jgi:4-hydroxybenzoate polyprenyltransferase